MKRTTGTVLTEDGISLFYEEYGAGGPAVISAQAGFYPKGMQQALAE